MNSKYILINALLFTAALSMPTNDKTYMNKSEIGYNNDSLIDPALACTSSSVPSAIETVVVLAPVIATSTSTAGCTSSPDAIAEIVSPVIATATSTAACTSTPDATPENIVDPEYEAPKANYVLEPTAAEPKSTAECTASPKVKDETLLDKNVLPIDGYNTPPTEAIAEPASATYASNPNLLSSAHLHGISIVIIAASLMMFI